MIRIAICDDSVKDVEKLERYLEALPFSVDIDVFYKGSDLFGYINCQEDLYHLYFLDIELGDIKGTDLAREIRRRDEQCLIVFLTGHPGYVYDIFDINVFDYIVKSVTRDRMDKLMCRVKKTLEKQGRIFYYNFNKVRYGLNAERIYLFQKNCRQIEIYTQKDGVLYTYMKMDEVMEQLNDRQFARVSYSCIVNLKYVAEIKGQIICMSNGMNINITRKQLKEVKEKHLKYLSGEVWQWSS
ncbi:MAG: response regulator transcription factor [Clostridiales bacterium]|nr:response regulator transcription factor [Clostridiales bacterium]